MNWLLDTHVWVWSQLEPERLGDKSRQVLLDKDENLYLSTISTLEFARLVEGGRIALETSVENWVRRAISHLAVNTVTLSHSHAIESYALPVPFHRDPADRMLVATARLEELTLITADQRILDYEHVQTLDARS